jgi:hypothetical protein
MQLYPCAFAERRREKVVHGAHALRFRNDVNVVQERKQILPRLQVRGDIRKCVMNAEAEQEGH